MKIRNYDKEHERIELQMTPMIDIVFQLLVFFIMTFKIVTQEGDFNIKMPLAASDANPTTVDSLPPIKVRMRANDDGMLTLLQADDRNLTQDTLAATFEMLRQEILGRVGDERGPNSDRENTEIELDCDYGLDYRYVIQAITAVSGYVNKDGQTVKLIDKIKFAAPRTSG